MKILFTGLHLRPGFEALDSRTRTGKIIDRVIARLPDGLKCEKRNLYPDFKVPDTAKERQRARDLFFIHHGGDNAIWVLLGKQVQQSLRRNGVCLAHPGSLRFGGDAGKYIEDSVRKIVAAVRLREIRPALPPRFREDETRPGCFFSDQLEALYVYDRYTVYYEDIRQPDVSVRISLPITAEELTRLLEPAKHQ